MCSMISSQCDELRKTADELDERAKAYAPTGRNVLSPMLRTAADTIWELRGDLQRANEAVQEAEHDESMAWDRVRKVEAENAKLRGLVQNLKRHVCKMHRDEPCAVVCDAYDSGLGRCVYEAKMRELGIEVE